MNIQNTYIICRLFLRMSVEVNHLTIVPSPILLLNVGQVEAGCTQPLPIIWINLGNPAVVGSGVQKII